MVDAGGIGGGSEGLGLGSGPGAPATVARAADPLRAFQSALKGGGRAIDCLICRR